MSNLPKGQQISMGQRVVVVNNKLGSGAFGTVYKVFDANRTTYALKAVICKSQSSIDSVKREASTLAKADHERIVRIMGFRSCTIDGESVFLILTEFCSGGDLNSRLQKTSTRETNLKWICQISEALSYLHSLSPPIVHRDLKADNVLLKDQYTEDLKLGDFGLAREYLAMKDNDGSSQPAQMYYMTSGTGPIHWMAPEFFDQHYTEKADIFSLGGIFYAILTRDYIQIGFKKMYGVFLTYQLQGKVGLGYAMAEINPRAKVLFPSCFQGSNSMRRLIEKMLNYDPRKRPSANEVKDSVENIRSSIELAVAPSQPGSSCC